MVYGVRIVIPVFGVMQLCMLETPDGNEAGSPHSFGVGVGGTGQTVLGSSLIVSNSC
jgi:hypothetical protein